MKSISRDITADFTDPAFRVAMQGMTNPLAALTSPSTSIVGSRWCPCR
ncbi:MAG: hypothetical protein LBB75_03820 [Oscillospiraceae bacterium]|nr:hypothetical protein [Oscillospiraceae bacterium]